MSCTAWHKIPNFLLYDNAFRQMQTDRYTLSTPERQRMQLSGLSGQSGSGQHTR